MSQSDYIKHLKLATKLKQQNEFQPVLSSKDYILYKEYNIANTVKNNFPLYDNLHLSGITYVFDMPLPDMSNCPVFIECKNTNNRPYRVRMNSVYFTPRPVPIYKKQLPNHKCSACCYDTSINGKNRHKGNFFNTNFTTFSNFRMRKMMCNCRKL